MPKQLYLVIIAKMMTTDDSDVVMKWSAVFDEDAIKEHEIINTAAEFLDANTPSPELMGDVRPMTKEEIDEWRKEN